MFHNTHNSAKPKSGSVPTKVLLLFSGGIDSTACIHYYTSRGFYLMALFIDYGQPDFEEEWRAATAVCDHYKIRLRKITLGGKKVASRYVRARNAALLTIALMNFEDDAGIVAIGIHSGTPYVDCSPDFIATMSGVFSLYEGGRVRIDTPFLAWSKQEILMYARDNGVPLHLTHTSNPEDIVPTYASAATQR